MASAPTAVRPAIVYPEDDGNPMSDNTLQFRWIVTLQGGLDALFVDDPNVFVAGDLLWYPVEGEIAIRQAPDVMVVFGRPKGDRGSYRQWEEGSVAPQVVFEVLSPGNRPGEMSRKLLFYETHGVEEYYVYDPDRIHLAAHLRGLDGRFELVPRANGHTSPRLGIQFDMSGPELAVLNPDGTRFRTYLELVTQSARAEAGRQRAEAERQRAEAGRQRAEAERQRAEAERSQMAMQLAAFKDRLRAAGIDPDAPG